MAASTATLAITAPLLKVFWPSGSALAGELMRPEKQRKGRQCAHVAERSPNEASGPANLQVVTKYDKSLISMNF